MFLRWVTRNGERVLQQQIKAWSLNGGIDIFVDVPTHQEPKKVTVVDELQQIMQKRMDDDFVQMGELYSMTCAKAAIEFFKARMPNYSSATSSQDYHFGYREAIRDVRKALFGEE